MPRMPATSGAARAGEPRQAFARAIVRWYRSQRRDLPWRRTLDPYAIWVSEIMLQQTRVEAVIPFYERFLARFPTVDSLATARLDDVLAHWAGLGYYRRARQLKAASESVVRDHAGRLPSEEKSLRALPGIGRYTAGAIRSIAFGEPAPIVDGNVARVLSRCFALRGAPGDRAWEKRLWELSASLVPRSDPSSFNQGLMELGAVVCLPRGPRCEICPLERACRARALGRAEAFPGARPRPRTKQVELRAVVLVRRGRYLLRRRGELEHNAGFWEFPLFEPPGHRAGIQVWLARALRQLAAPLGSRARFTQVEDHPGEVRHSILSKQFRIRIVRAELTVEGQTRASRAWKWVRTPDFEALPFTAASRKIAHRLGLQVRATGHRKKEPKT